MHLLYRPGGCAASIGTPRGHQSALRSPGLPVRIASRVSTGAGQRRHGHKSTTANVGVAELRWPSSTGGRGFPTLQGERSMESKEANEMPSVHFDTVDVALALLALGAGSMDALGFFALGGAFPSAVTGNTALLGLAVGRGD